MYLNVKVFIYGNYLLLEVFWELLLYIVILNGCKEGIFCM